MSDEVAINPENQIFVKKALQAIDVLEQITVEDAARVPEPIFKEHILPMLVDRRKAHDLTFWQQIAGNVFRPLDIVDPKNNSVLFRCPSVLRMINVRITKGGRDSVYEIVKTSDQKSKIIPALGDKHINEALTHRFYHHPVNIDDILNWNKILTHYGYPPFIDLEPVEKPSDQPSANQDVFIEYEDF